MCVYRWKEETKSMTDKFGETIINLRNEVASYKKRNEAKKVEMHTLSRQRDQQSRQLERLQASQTQLHRQLRESESRAEAAAAQVMMNATYFSPVQLHIYFKSRVTIQYVHCWSHLKIPHSAD
jgi:chromosome segregation ATPase